MAQAVPIKSPWGLGHIVTSSWQEPSLREIAQLHQPLTLTLTLRLTLRLTLVLTLTLTLALTLMWTI